MFKINGQKHGYCDGVSRRNFLKIGAMGLGGLTLPDLLRMEAQAGIGSSHKAIISIHLAGGPPHTDMFDLKPEAPSEYRGEFMPISTNVPGMQICEHMPRLARMADKWVAIRSVVGAVHDHTWHHTQSGYYRKHLENMGGWPVMGSVLSKLQNSSANKAPPFMSMLSCNPAKHTCDPPSGFLGPAYQPYQPGGSGRANLTLNEITADRLSDRVSLLGGLDHLRRDLDASGMMEAMDAFTQRAVEVVTSGRLADALDLDKEDPKIKARYYDNNSHRYKQTRQFLLARRVIEAGVRCVSLSWGSWDTHGDNFNRIRPQLPALDRGLSALIQDLDERGMLNDVSIVMWGEFGRTPRINNAAGRDHWTRVMTAFLAGGGMQTGQMIGKTDQFGGEAIERPIHLREVLATLYHNVGIDAKNTTIVDPTGRPHYLVDNRDPIRELI